MMAKCKECYHYSACFEMAKINLQELGISDYDANADGCKDFIAAENVVILNPERTIATKLPAQTHDLPCGGYQEVDSALDIPAVGALWKQMLYDINYEERLAEAEKRKIRFKKYEPLKEDGKDEDDAEE